MTRHDARHSYSRLFLTVTTLWLAAGAAACAQTVQAADPGNVRDQRVTIRVINRGFNDATLWANMVGSRRLIGRLSGKTEADYSLDVRFSQPITIEINLVAGDTCITNELMVDPGDELFLSIEPALEEMGICRRRG